MKRIQLALTALLLGGCAASPDMTPIGGGLAIIGLAVIVSAVIQSLPSHPKGGDDDEPGT